MSLVLVLGSPKKYVSLQQISLENVIMKVLNTSEKSFDKFVSFNLK